MPSRGLVSLVAHLGLQLGGAVVLSPNGDTDVSPDLWPVEGSASPKPYAWPSPQVEFEYTDCDPEQFRQKRYDVAVFGAAGRMGQAVWDEFKRMGADRPQVALIIHQDTQEWFYQMALRMGPEAAGAENFTFSMDLVKHPEKLIEMTNQSRVVLNLAGPYERNGGESLVRAAMKGCAHYVDLSTETKWKRRIYDQFNMKAAQRKLAIVQAAGFNAVAADLLAMSAADDLVSASSQMPTHVAVSWEVLNDVVEPSKKLAEQGAFYRHGFTADPYILAPEVPIEMRVDRTVDGRTDENLGLTPMFDGQSLEPYTPSKLECPIIRRSLHAQYPHNAISVQEVCTTAMVSSMVAFRRGLAAEGEASAQSMMMRGSFLGKGIAMLRPNATEGEQEVPWTRVMLEGRGDPHYVATPKIAVQIALGLLYEGPQRFGYLTPTMALGTKNLEKRLTSVDGGNVFRIHHGV